MMDDLMRARQRYALWNELCDLADRLLDLTHRWYDLDPDLYCVQCDGEPDDLAPREPQAALDDARQAGCPPTALDPPSTRRPD